MAAHWSLNGIPMWLSATVVAVMQSAVCDGATVFPVLYVIDGRRQATLCKGIQLCRHPVAGRKLARRFGFPSSPPRNRECQRPQAAQRAVLMAQVVQDNVDGSVRYASRFPCPAGLAAVLMAAHVLRLKMSQHASSTSPAGLATSHAAVLVAAHLCHLAP